MPATATALMSFENVTSLVACEYEFVNVDVAVSALMARVRLLPFAEAKDALGDLAVIRCKLAKTLEKLDGPITEAVKIHEETFPAPF